MSVVTVVGVKVNMGAIGYKGSFVNILKRLKYIKSLICIYTLSTVLLVKQNVFTIYLK